MKSTWSPRKIPLLMSATIALSAIGLTPTLANAASQNNAQQGGPAITSCYQPHAIYIRFRDGIDPEQAMADLTNPKSRSFEASLKGAEWQLAFPKDKQADFKPMHSAAVKKLGRNIPKPWQGVYARTSGDASVALDALAASKLVDKALPVPKIGPAPLLAPPGGDDPDWPQLYLESAAENGVEARQVWEDYGVRGSGVAMCDIEFDVRDHCDLPPITFLNPTPPAPTEPDNLFNERKWHAVAVLGTVASLDNGTGTTGIAPDVDEVMFASAMRQTSSGGPWAADYVSAINLATTALRSSSDKPGSVIILELQLAGPNYDGMGGGYVPLEWWEPAYNAIQIAVASDLIVVEAAGNGFQNLDDPVYSTGNGGHWPFLPENDSGAIMVGAGGSGLNGTTARARHGFSNYGSTVDVQGWGDSVTTTGLHADEDRPDDNCAWTPSFSGTSSASPIVAGACLLVQSYMKDRHGTTLSAANLNMLLQATSQAQQAGSNPVTQRIGGLPNAHQAIGVLADITGQPRWVPTDYPTIQAAVDAANPNDTILVGPGSWSPVASWHKSLKIIGIGGPDATVIDGADTTRGIFWANSDLHLQGMTIREGNAGDGPSPGGDGGGLWHAGGTLIVRDCKFIDNSASNHGGGIFSGSDPVTIEESTFEDNTAINYGAGVYLVASDAAINDSRFHHNTADYGGGISSQALSTTVRRCEFSQNYATTMGGALDLWGGMNTVQESQFDFNFGRQGGGISISITADAAVHSCHFHGSSSSREGAAIYADSGAPAIDSCGFSENIAGSGAAGIYGTLGSLAEVQDSTFCVNLPAHTNDLVVILDDNCFTDSCTDSDEDGTPDSCPTSIADVNGDGDVGVDDLLQIIAAFGPCDECPEDLNGDGFVDVTDLLLVLDCWSGGC